MDFEIIPTTESLGRKFAYDLSRQEFQALSQKRKSWTHLLYKDSDAGKKTKAVPYLRRGAMIDEKILKIFQNKNVPFVPVLQDFPGTPIKTRLSTFSRTQSSILIGRVFTCVQDWLHESGAQLSQGVKNVMQLRMRELSRALGSTFRDMQALVTHVVQELVAMEDYLTAVGLYEDLLAELQPRALEGDDAESIGHALQVMVMSTILAYRAGLRDTRLRQTAQAAILHDVGLVVAYEWCREELLTRRSTPWQFGELALLTQRRHPALGALLLTRRDGHPIAGIDPVVRAIILEHECAINGTGTTLFIEEQGSEIQKLGIRPDTRVHGHNKLSSTVDQEQLYKLVGMEKSSGAEIRRMTMGAQVVAVVEQFQTRIQRQRPQEVMRSMILDAGTKLNMSIFDIFLNSMIPFRYLPQGAVFQLRGKNGSPLEQYDGSGVMVHGKDGIDFLVLRDRDGKKIKPVAISQDEIKANGRLMTSVKSGS